MRTQFTRKIGFVLPTLSPVLTQHYRPLALLREAGPPLEGVACGPGIHTAPMQPGATPGEAREIADPGRPAARSAQRRPAAARSQPGPYPALPAFVIGWRLAAKEDLAAHPRENPPPPELTDHGAGHCGSTLNARPGSSAQYCASRSRGLPGSAFHWPWRWMPTSSIISSLNSRGC